MQLYKSAKFAHTLVILLIVSIFINLALVSRAYAQCDDGVECGQWYDWATLGISCVIRYMSDESDEKVCQTAVTCHEQAQAEKQLLAEQQKENHKLVEENQALLAENQRLLEEQQAILTSLQQQVSLLEKYENVRTIVPREIVDQQVCPKDSKAAHVPLSYRGKSGDAICRANRWQEKSCEVVRHIQIKSSNRFSTHFETNKLQEQSCQTAVSLAWPWGYSNTEPTTAQGSSAGSTWVVCCKN
jgi:hypothetical protein